MSPPACPKRASIPFSSKRARLAAPDVARPWTSLPGDLVQLIGWQVLLAGDLRDYVRFRAACSDWSSSAARPRGRGLLEPRFHPRRWMMLPEGRDLRLGHPDLGRYVRFLNLSSGALVRVHLPLFDDHTLLDSSDGLLLLRRNNDTVIRLLHPFTGDITDLPPFSSLLPQIEPHIRHLLPIQYSWNPEQMAENCRRCFFSWLPVCAVTVSSAGAITVMLNLPLDIGKRLIHVAHATAGDQQWTLSGWKIQPLIAGTSSFQGKLYAVAAAAGNSADRVCIYQIEPPQSTIEGGSSPLPPPRMIAECPLLVRHMGAANLVECGSELMLVGFSDDSFAHLVVYRFSDLIGGRVVPTTNIGDHAFFLGERGLCISPGKWLPSVSANSITRKRKVARFGRYKPSYQRFGKTFQQYHLGSGTWSATAAFDDDILGSDRGPARPYTLDRHIFTCCSRGLWSKGLMMVSGVKPDSSKLRKWLEQGS